MDSGYVTQAEYKEHNVGVEAEQTRQNNRIKLLEEAIGQNNKLIISVERLALSMENMQKELKEQGERVNALESRDGDNWRKLGSDVIKILISIVIGFIFAQIGIS